MNIKDVENLAELAKIELSESEKKAILEDMEGILAYVKVIEEVEVLDVEPKYNLNNVWREDLPRLAQAGQDITHEFSHELITSQFPDAQDGFLKVKKIL